MKPQRLPNEDLHYVVHAFNRPGDAPGLRIQANASYFPMDETGAGSYDPAEGVTLHLSVHIDRDTPKELVAEALRTIAENIDELYQPLTEMRGRWERGEDPIKPIVVQMGDA